MPQDVCLSLLILVFFLSNVATTSSYHEHLRKILQLRQGAFLNRNSTLTDVVPMITEASTHGSKRPIYYAAYGSGTTPKGGYAGGMATFDVHGFPNLRYGDYSAAQIFVEDEQNYDYNTINSIQAGWEIAPETYGDSKTHFFVYWTADGFNSTGCFNLECRGFVPVNGAPITPGDPIEPTDGQAKISVKIFKNKDDGDWWLHFGYDINSMSRVGYWPKDLFTRLVDKAGLITWGGVTMSYGGNPSPPMGNGQWPGKKSASVHNVQYIDTNGQGYSPVWPSLRIMVTNKKCYQASIFVDNMFYYGGPGGCTN